ERVARTRKQPLSDDLTRPDRVRGELEGYWGQVLEAEGKPAQAIGCYRLATRHHPEQETNYARLAFLLRRSNETDPAKRKANLEEADNAVNDMVTRTKGAHHASLARWRYRRDFDLLALKQVPTPGQVPLEEAARDVSQALAQQPNSVEALLAAADL